MIEQLSLDQALEEVEANADSAWKEIALSKVKHLCLTRYEFTADEFWAAMSKVSAATHEPRVFGAIMRQAAAAGFCMNTNRVQKTTRTVAHSRPIAIWQSLLFPPSL
jgi:hypothetical protein